MAIEVNRLYLQNHLADALRFVNCRPTPMIKILRKHRNWLMIVIAILALPFCLYFVKSDTSLIRSDEFAQIYGQKISLIQARRDAGLFQLAEFLGMSDLTNALAPGQAADNQRMAGFV